MEYTTNTSHYTLRPLNPISDDLTNYLSWMRDTDQNDFIEGANVSITYEELADYVDARNKSDSAVLFGIFTKLDNIHIGNVKLEPIIFEEFAWLGILIGDLRFRGKGAGFEVIRHLLEFAKYQFNLKSILLGVHEDNIVALKLYKKLGFKRTFSETTKLKTVSMKFDLNQRFI